jgi:diguanylate cyclase (GGDEF)-like protein
MRKSRLLATSFGVCLVTALAIPYAFDRFESQQQLLEAGVALHELQLRETRVSERILRAQAGYFLPWGSLIEATSARQRQHDRVERLLQESSFEPTGLRAAFDVYREQAARRLIAIEQVETEYASLRRALRQLPDLAVEGDEAHASLISDIHGYLRRSDSQARQRLLEKIDALGRSESGKAATPLSQAARLVITQRDIVTGLAPDALVQEADLTLSAMRAIVEREVPSAKRRAEVLQASLVGLSGLLCVAVFWVGLRLRRSAAHLDAANAELEHRVEERTSALEAAVDALEKEVEQRRSAEEANAFLAYHDVLTGLPNRELLRDRVEQTLYQRSRDGKMAAVLFLDLDGFKQINDTHGHAFGDEILRAVAERLESCVRDTDCVTRIESPGEDATISRQGGDEFIVLLARTGTREDVGRVAKRILLEISQPFPTSRGPMMLGVSVGIALYPQDGDDVENLLRSADTAMYEAKSAGGGIHRFFDERMHERVQTRHRIEYELRRAIERDELTLHYQPQIDLESARVRCLEALVRWEHPVDGLVPPAEFIPIAEASNLIIDLGEWVIDRAARDAAELARNGFATRVAVNLSARHFRVDRLADTIAAALQRHGLDGSALEVEVTETAMLDNRENAARTLESLREAGIETALDDFGTGYSSLSYLRALPLDRVKIDQAFIASLDESPEIVEAVVWMSHSIGLRVVAEGVEQPAQLECLRQMHCDAVQGYLLARPVPFDEIGAACEAAERAAQPSTAPEAA